MWVKKSVVKLRLTPKFRGLDSQIRFSNLRPSVLVSFFFGFLCVPKNCNNFALQFFRSRFLQNRLQFEIENNLARIRHRPADIYTYTYIFILFTLR